MKKQLLKLFNEAGFHQPEMERLIVEHKFEKFAQLIVRECVTLADIEAERFSNLDQEYCAMAMDNYRELVLKHFGVE
jgi:hypothetical protein